MSTRNLAAAVLAAFVTLGAAAAGPAVAAGEATVAAPGSDALLAERARLRAELDRVNAEIDSLKRAGGGMRDDYRLRARLADAESLARKLIDIEARLGLHLDSARAQPKPQPPPTATATDGPADLDAKADILADQSRRLRTQADGLGRRAGELKGRQELRKRVADLDRDPFAPMEGSKRRIASAATITTTRESAGPVVGGAGAGTRAPGGASNDIATPPTTSTGNSGFGPAPGPQSPVAPIPVVTSTALSVQLRDLLDTATLADIRKLEAGGAGPASPQALDRAAAALRARADMLEGQSRAMRARARSAK